MRIRPLLILCLLILSFSFIHAQDNVTWRAVYLNPINETEGEFIVINNQGYEKTMPIPEKIYEPAREGNLAVGILLSPDLRYLVANYDRASQESGEARSIIYDLVNDTQAEIKLPEGYAQILRGFAFNPDGTRLAAVFLMTETADSTRGGAGILTVNPVDGQIDQTVNVTQLNEAVESENEEIWVYTGDWIEGGIEFTPACLNCEGITPAPMWLWNPDESIVTQGVRYYLTRGTMLGATGEVLMAELDRDYPMKEDQDAYLPQSNVIKYYPAGVIPEEVDGRVVYFNEKNLPLGNAIWGMDGQAFFTRQQGEAEGVFVLRDGTTFTTPVPKGPMLVTGTPDGWLLIDQTGRIFDTRITGDTVALKEVFKFAFSDTFDLNSVGASGIILTPRYGASAGDEIFPEIGAPNS